MPKDLSFIIVNFKTPDLLIHTLHTVENIVPSGYLHEIIVVDNNSQDGSVELIRKNSPRAVLIENKENIGFGRANNQAAKIARGEYLVFVNPDIRIVTGAIKDMLDFMNAHPQVGFLGPKIIWPDGKIQVSTAEFLGLGWAMGHHLYLKNILLGGTFRKALAPFRKILGKALRSYLFVYEDLKDPWEVDWLSGAFLVVRRSVFEELGGFDEDYFLYFEDQDLCLRGREKGYKAYYFPSVVIEHQVGASMKKNPRALIERYRSELIFWIKHYSPLSLFTLRILMGIDFSLRWFFTVSKEKKKIYSEILHYVFSPRNYILKTPIKL